MIKLGPKELILQDEETERAYSALAKYCPDQKRGEWGYTRSTDFGYGRLAHHFKKLYQEEYLTVCEGYANEF